jgi:hypothetical protein
VAADLRNDYFALLQVNNNGDVTNSKQNLRAYAPKVSEAANEDAADNYEAFILRYMDTRYSNNPSVGTFNYPNAISAYSLEDYYLNNPVGVDKKPIAIQIKPTPTEKSADSKWSHVRGLYVDFIERDAQDVIENARKKCAATGQDGRNACVLPYVPFTSINLTELADWKSKLDVNDADLNKDVIQVANNSFYDPTNSNVPTRGNVFAGIDPDDTEKAFAIPYITESNSGLALESPIDPEELILNDSQEYQVSGGGSGGTTAISFKINISGQSAEAPYPQVGDALTGNSCTTGSPNPYACAFAPDANNYMQIKASGYTKLKEVNVPNGCKNNGNVGLPIIIDYDITEGIASDGTVVLPSSVSGDRTVGDTTYLAYAPVAAGSSITMQFSGPIRYCPANYSPIIKNKPKNTDPDPVGYDCKNNNPTWSSTLVICPDGTP